MQNVLAKEKLHCPQCARGTTTTRDAVNSALSEASESIRSALALQRSISAAATAAGGGEQSAADAKTQREDMLNQLMTLLNTAYAAGKKVEAERAASPGSRHKLRCKLRVR